MEKKTKSLAKKVSVSRTMKWSNEDETRRTARRCGSIYDTTSFPVMAGDRRRRRIGRKNGIGEVAKIESRASTRCASSDGCKLQFAGFQRRSGPPRASNDNGKDGQMLFFLVAEEAATDQNAMHLSRVVDVGDTSAIDCAIVSD